MLDHIFISLPTLSTEQLLLRKLVYADKSDIFSYAKNPEVSKYVIWNAHETEFDSLEFLNIVYEAYNKNRPAPWGIQLKNDPRIIGTAGFVEWNKEKNEAEIGYALSQDHWNKGFITEAVREIIKFGFNVMKLERITSRCKPENTGSYKILEKCGFDYDGTVKNQMLMKGSLHDMRMYSLTNNNYINSYEL